jgi:hypothetical protein
MAYQASGLSEVRLIARMDVCTPGEYKLKISSENPSPTKVENCW